LTQRARDLRRGATKEECIVWRWLRDRRLRGIKFRRQHPIDNYIADFYCVELKLVVEIDGSGHDSVAQQFYESAAATGSFRTPSLRTRMIEMPSFDRSHLIAAIERVKQEYQPSPGLRPPSPASGRGR
jgi:very-short-patch-repair endonuclease